MVRAPNGNDYGKDLLRQHYLTSPHHTTALGGDTVDSAPLAATDAIGNVLGRVVWGRL